MALRVVKVLAEAEDEKEKIGQRQDMLVARSLAVMEEHCKLRIGTELNCHSLL